MSITGGGNLYPSWLGSASLSVPNNTINTTVTVQGIGTYTTTVDIVPNILLSSVSTAQLNTTNPSEILTYITPATGWYKSEWTGFGRHTSGGDWSNFSQLDWYLTKNNAVQSNTAVIIKPQFTCGDSVSEFISLPGQGVISANAGDVIQWVCDGNATPAVTSNYFAGFSWITHQKIG